MEVEKIIGNANVDRSSQVFTLFLRLPVQKDTLFSALNSEIVYPVLRLKTLKTIPCSAAHTPHRPNKGVFPSGFAACNYVELVSTIFMKIPLPFWRKITNGLEINIANDLHWVMHQSNPTAWIGRIFFFLIVSNFYWSRIWIKFRDNDVNTFTIMYDQSIIWRTTFPIIKLFKTDSFIHYIIDFNFMVLFWPTNYI